MTTRAQIIARAQSFLGYKERGNNLTEFWARQKPSFQGSPWCAAFTVDVYDHFGIKTLKTGPALPFYCPSIMAWAKRSGRWIATKNAKPGDLIIFSFGGPRASHIGILERQISDDVMQTIEGNTSPGNSGSQTNGGGVYRRRRYRSAALGAVSMAPDLSAPVSTDKAPAMAKTPNVYADLQRVMRDRYGCHDADGTPLDVDGVFGPNTWLALGRVMELKRSRLRPGWAKLTPQNKKNTHTIRLLQWYVGAPITGEINTATLQKLSKKLKAGTF